MIWGADERARTAPPQTLASASPKMLFLALLIALGLYVPRPVALLMLDVTASLERR
jgi:hypothetical protein